MSLRAQHRLFLLLVLLDASACRASNPKTKVVFEGPSEFNGKVYVVDSADGVRSLHFELGGAIQSAIVPGKPLDLQLRYTQAAMVALGPVAKPKKVLIVGVGGGAMPTFLRKLYPDLQIEAVDIDPAVIAAARKYFDLREDARLKAIAADGRKFVEESPGGYDIIFLDAFGDSAIPKHLATVEFMKLVRGKLAPGGIVASNVWAQESNPLHDAMRATYEATFPRFCEVEVTGSSNRIFLADAGEGTLDIRAFTDELGMLAGVKKLPFDLAGYAARGCLPGSARQVEVLKDP